MTKSEITVLPATLDDAEIAEIEIAATTSKPPYSGWLVSSAQADIANL